jgi:hypothetical protein
MEGGSDSRHPRVGSRAVSGQEPMMTIASVNKPVRAAAPVSE